MGGFLVFVKLIVIMGMIGKNNTENECLERKMQGIATIWVAFLLGHASRPSMARSGAGCRAGSRPQKEGYPYPGLDWADSMELNRAKLLFLAFVEPAG